MESEASPAPLRQVVGRIIRSIREWFCRHEFQLADLNKINEDGPERVSWPCVKCGKVFTAHCGLDIAPRHGFIIPPNPAGQPTRVTAPQHQADRVAGSAEPALLDAKTQGVKP